MQRNIFYALIIVPLLSTAAQAQLPRYSYTTYDPNGTITSISLAADNTPLKVQSLYYPTSFPGMPGGLVKAVYVRVGNNPLGTTSSNYTLFTVKLGYTNDSTFPNGTSKYDTFKTGLTTVYGPANFAASGTDSIGRWIKIPVTAGNFSYSPEKKFVAEFAMARSTRKMALISCLPIKV